MHDITHRHNLTYLVVIVVFFAGILALSVYLYHWQVEKAKSQEYEFFQSSLSEKIQVLIQEKKNTTQALAIALSSPIDFRKALIERDETVRERLKVFGQRFRDLTEYKDIWIQLIDANGVSFARSWTDKHGDSLAEVRQDVASILKQPRRISAFSVGKFALTFKSIEPLFDEKGKFIGMIDVISQVNSIDNALLQSKGTRSVVLVDKRYLSQLTNAYTQKFIGDYYVANMGARQEDMNLVHEVGVNALISAKSYSIANNTLIVPRPILDIHGRVMANWVTLKPLSTFSFPHMKTTQRQLILIFAFIIMLLFFLVVMSYLKRKVDFEKKLFFEVFNSSSEIVYLTDRRQLLFANKRFFDTFNSFHNLEEFHKVYGCVCEMFMEEEGYLQQYMNGVFWYDYIMENKDKSHYAKVMVQGKEHIFRVKAGEVSSAFGKQYVSILMSDITEEERYKSELEHLIVHDELTGVYNRHFFNQYLSEEINRHQRYQTQFSMAVIDVDHFKRINDQYGHDVGDMVLVNISNTLGRLVRDSDVLCRVGGEEFVLMMPETRLKDAEKVVEKLRKAVESITHSDVPETQTISVGVTELTHWDTSQSLYKRADQLLYKAKDSGRNQVVSSHSS